MRKFPLLTLLALVASCVLTVDAHADDARIKVATLDGTPVYRWRAFKSFVTDDVDRALIIREFQRKGFELPPKLIDEAVNQQIADQFGGNRDKFLHHLHDEGVTLADFRAFCTEEIIVNSMLYTKAQTPADGERLRAQWLAGLRAGAVVKRLPAYGKKTTEG